MAAGFISLLDFSGVNGVFIPPPAEGGFKGFIDFSGATSLPGGAPVEPPPSLGGGGRREAYVPLLLTRWSVIDAGDVKSRAAVGIPTLTYVLPNSDDDDINLIRFQPTDFH